MRGVSSLTNGMTRVLGLLLPLALVPAASAGQRFFDDFDGEVARVPWHQVLNWPSDLTETANTQHTPPTYTSCQE